MHDMIINYDYRITIAEISDANVLTSITKQSKAYWGYTEELLKEWDTLLTITKDYLIKNEVYKLIHKEEIIGYYSYYFVDEKIINFDNLFVLPNFIGKGFGKILINDFLEKISQRKIDKVILEADPNAELFYKHFGFKTIGHKESSIKNRYLPIMELRLNDNFS